MAGATDFSLLLRATRALSIQQPWSWLIVNGHKDIENRDWPTRFRGPVLIHAGKKIDAGNLPYVAARFDLPAAFALGGIVGVAEIVDCVRGSNSPWWGGPYGFVIRNASPLPFIPCRGALGFFAVPPDVHRACCGV